MRSVEAILADTSDSAENYDDNLRQFSGNLTKHTIELDLQALERAGKWGAARVDIGGKIYQLFPVEAA